MSAPVPETEAPVRGILDVIVFSALFALCVVLAAAVRVGALFQPAGAAVRMPRADAPATLALDGAPDIYRVVDAMVLVPGLDPGTLAWLTASVALTAIAALVVLGALMRIALAFRHGRLFTRTTARALATIGAVIFAASCLVILADGMGQAGVAAALGLPYEGIFLPDLVAYAPAGIAAIVFVMLASAFERGQRMQHDTEGLV